MSAIPSEMATILSRLSSPYDGERVAAALELGLPAEVIRGTQIVKITGTRIHINRHGKPVTLFELTVACKQCGAPFETTVRKDREFSLKCRRRCFTCSPFRAR